MYTLRTSIKILFKKIKKIQISTSKKFKRTSSALGCRFIFQRQIKHQNKYSKKYNSTAKVYPL